MISPSQKENLLISKPKLMKNFKNPLKATLLSLPLLFALTACGKSEPPSLEERMNKLENGAALPAEDTLEYSLKDVKAQVSTRQEPFAFNSLQLTSMASSCGKEQQKEYFQSLVEKFEAAQAQRTVYSFKYEGESQGTGTYNVFLLPNVPQYDSLKELKQDFEFCGKSGRAYPTLVSEDWLLFTGSCLPADEEAELVDGCSEIKTVVDPTFKLKR